MPISSLVDDSYPALCELRHRLHQIPELGYHEVKTAALIRAELDRLGIAHIDGVEGAPTATIAWIGDPSRRCIALRADIDALPIVEQTGAPYASTHPGAMHACGHDGHMTMLLGAAGVLKAMEKELDLCVKLLFQPAEEGGGGAQKLVDAGVLDGGIGPRVEAIFGLHGWPALPVGDVATRPGAMMAATDRFVATFTGKGCHGAYPHLGIDPIVTAAQAVLSLQQLVSREVSPLDSAVITVGMFNAGTAVNIIPDTATIQGTVRTLLPETRADLQEAVERRCAGIAAASRCTLDFAWHCGYPATVNDPAMADYVAKTARELLGDDRFQTLPTATMGGEDFSFYLQKIPGCFIRVGVDVPGRPLNPSLHSDHFNFTDEAIPVGVKLFVTLALNWTARNRPKG